MPELEAWISFQCFLWVVGVLFLLEEGQNERKGRLFFFFWRVVPLKTGLLPALAQQHSQHWQCKSAVWTHLWPHLDKKWLNELNVVCLFVLWDMLYPTVFPKIRCNAWCCDVCSSKGIAGGMGAEMTRYEEDGSCCNLHYLLWMRWF